MTTHRALDLLTGPRTIRSWIYLMLHFIFGTLYFSWLVTGLSIGGSLAIILIGIPILAFTLASSRFLVSADRYLGAILLDSPAPEGVDLSGFRGSNWWGPAFSSDTFVRTLYMLFARFPLGILGLTVGSILFPFYILELIIASMGVQTGGITGRIVQSLALGLNAISGRFEAGSGKRKHDFAPEKAKRSDVPLGIEADDSDGEIAYYLDDDGEIVKAKRG